MYGPLVFILNSFIDYFFKRAFASNKFSNFVKTFYFFPFTLNCILVNIKNKISKGTFFFTLNYKLTKLRQRQRKSLRMNPGFIATSSLSLTFGSITIPSAFKELYSFFFLTSEKYTVKIKSF